MNNNAFEHLHHHIDVHALEEGGHSHAQSSKAGVLPTFLLSIQGFRIFFFVTGIEIVDMCGRFSEIKSFSTPVFSMFLKSILGHVLPRQMRYSSSDLFYSCLSSLFKHK